MKTHFALYPHIPARSSRVLGFMIAILLLALGATGCEDAPAIAETIEPAVIAQPEVSDTIAGEDRLEFPTAASARDYMRHSPDAAKYAAGILPQMADEALDYVTNLLNSKYEHFIIVDKQRMKVVLFDRFGREEATYGMACAKNYGTKHKRSDMRTPEGYFTVKGIFNSTDWLYTDDNGVTSPKKGQYGPRFIRLKTPVTNSIGIHGTCAPWSIGGRRSHGCIRLKNEDIMQLAEVAEKGMPVIVSPGKRDMAVNRDEGYDVEAVSSVRKASNT